MPWEAIVGLAAIDSELVAEVSKRLKGLGLEPPYLKAMPRWYY